MTNHVSIPNKTEVGINPKKLSYIVVFLYSILIVVWLYSNNIVISFVSIALSSLISCSIASILFAKYINSVNLSIELPTNIGMVDTLLDIYIHITNVFFSILKIRNVLLLTDPGLKSHLHKVELKNNTISIHIKIHGYSGTHVIRGILIKFDDIMQIFDISFKIVFKDEITIRIIPSSVIYIPSTITLRQYIPYAPLTLRRKGVGIEILSVRDYIPGDEYRKIAWKHTARLGKLMVKEFEALTHRNAIIVISIHSDFFTEYSDIFEILVERILGLTLGLVRLGMSIRMGVITDESIFISNAISKNNVKDIYEFFSTISWSHIERMIRNIYSSNKILRWFTRNLTEEYCKEPCLVMLVLDPQDNFDIDVLKLIYNDLKYRGHTLQVVLISPLILKFLYLRANLNEFHELLNKIPIIKTCIRLLKSMNIQSTFTL
ncbi:protein of unknown function DUF58 [Ignisphaera aggregans DSM 17230]|uniref:DUF58 domain-containing protein n=1 Tax=Ignisphaera aggregans (strain DSM 17230 / JCM 13409 / AQ1.S1) TaxID=583356 RepID=E0SQV5_IGNAA|nr:protein of unknown function DUF58 [Ignisphaera aggregans DSM 17230]